MRSRPQTVAGYRQRRTDELPPQQTVGGQYEMAYRSSFVLSLLSVISLDGRKQVIAAVAQLVEQGTENPCVNSSILFGGMGFEQEV